MSPGRARRNAGDEEAVGATEFEAVGAGQKE